MFLCYTTHTPSLREEMRHLLKRHLPEKRRARYSERDAAPLIAYALLAYMLDVHAQVPDLQALRYSETGKPHLPSHAPQFSLSHCRDHVLCAMGALPLGCDMITPREVSPKLASRIRHPQDSDDFFVNWALKESYVKLFDDPQVSFSTLHFPVVDGAVTRDDCAGYIYHTPEGASAAVLSTTTFARPVLQKIDAETLFSYTVEKYT